MGLTKPGAFVCSAILTASNCPIEPVRNPPPDHLQENRVSIPLARSLSSQGIDTKAEIYANLGTAQLVEEALRNGEGALSLHGALVVKTGAHTGRSAKDKFIVRDSETENSVWWGRVNAPMTPVH